MPTVFLLSPARCSGERAARLPVPMFRAMGEVEVESAAFVQPLLRDARLVLPIIMR